MIETLCIHHNDPDGFCAAAIVKRFEKNVTTHSINYGYDVPWKKIKEANRVYMVDFGLQPFSDMVKILEMKGDNFIWIDHHKTSIDDRDLSGRTFQGLQYVGKAGCELTWEYFSQEPMPELVKMIGRYDVWDLEYSEHLFDVQAALKLHDIDGDSDGFWKAHFDDDDMTERLIGEGKICNRYQQNVYDKNCNSHSFELDWEGYRFVVCNALGVNSKLFDSKFDEHKHDAMMCFGYTNRNWSVSMYTNKAGVDVGALAKRYGGGGHCGASGFQCTDGLPFELKMKK